MRGQTKTVKSLVLSGNVYLRQYHEEEISKPKIGDLYLYLNDEEELYPVLMNDYQIKGYKGYFKTKVYDGRAWCFIDSLDFFEDRLHQFSKSEICFYTFQLCQERLIAAAGTIVYRSYREHYTTYLHEAGEYKGKKGVLKKLK